MDELIRVSEIKKEVESLNSSIEYLKGILKKTLLEKPDIGILFQFNPFEKVPERDRITEEFFEMENIQIQNRLQSSLVLKDSEFIIVIGTLVNFKTQKKKELIEEFNTIKGKLKVEL